MNRATADPSQEAQEGSEHWSPSVPRLGGARGGFMVPMHGIKVVACFSRPTRLYVTIFEFLGSNGWRPFE